MYIVYNRMTGERLPFVFGTYADAFNAARAAGRYYAVKEA